tara:strand:- start:4542 stop:6875 length:2334 start_codon:yes stop_codon:yes gene_type:complete
MRCLNTILLCILFFFCTTIGKAQYITVNDTYTAQNLVDLLTNKSPCANTSNPNVTGDTFSGLKNSYSYFNSGTSNFPFTEGVLLSTWSSTNSVGPFIRNQGGGSSFWKGDNDLDQALGIKSINATVLEFDFTPLTNFVNFNYIFASNEYQDDFPCRFSDGFAFLIKENGSTGTYKNLAVLPNTTTPVSSENVHPTISFTNTTGSTSGCAAKNETYFGQINTSPTNTSPINYSGQTVVLNAQTDVIAGNSYHIKLVIADDEFEYYDSAVFLQAGSFTSKVDLGADRLLATNNGICFGQNYIIDTKLPASYSYKWYKNNILLIGETSPSYLVKDAGTYKVEITLNPTICLATSEIKIEYTPEIVLKNTTLIQCDDNGDGIAYFDLTKAEPIIASNNGNLSQMIFYENSIDAQNDQNPILNPKNYSNKSNNQIVIAKVSDNYGCSKSAELTLSISNKNIAPLAPIIACDDDGISDGIHQFDLMAIATSGQFSSIGNNIFVTFYANPTDAYLEKNELPFLFKNTIPYQQTLYVRVLNGSDCYAITSITLVVNTFDPPNFEDENFPLCEGSALNIAVNNMFSSYLWNTGATSNSILVNTPGDYSVVVTDTNGCEATKKFHITASGIATITGATINDFAGNENSVELEYTGIGNYEFSLDGSYYQDNPIFNGIAAGDYLAYARDKNGCGLSNPFPLYVLDYPRYFTPNGDGFNDLWTIKNLDLLSKSTLTIFDRYGKLLKELSSNSLGWNGTFNGYQLPADDYWFHLTFTDGKMIKGHFSLKR